MAKSRKDLANPKTIADMWDEGRGKGEHRFYKPWLNVGDVPSQGISYRIPGWKTDCRPVQLMSKLELCFFYMKEWADDSTDFREQYPLNPELTEQIAKQEGIVHPRARLQRQSLKAILRKDPNAPKVRSIVMTTDVNVTMADGSHQAFAIKPKRKLSADDKGSERVKEKLRLEELYWEACGVPWKLITEDQLDPVLAKNVEYVHRCYFLKWYWPLTAKTVEQVFDWMSPKLADGSLSDLADKCDEDLHLESGSSLVLARHLIAHKRWPVDFSVRLNPCRPLRLLPVSAAA